nr:hypothetical protein Itr_chr08CG07040 [Ipomoea trifida]
MDGPEKGFGGCVDYYLRDNTIGVKYGLEIWY